MRPNTSARNPSTHDGLAMRASAKHKLAGCANTRDLFHRLCLLHRLNRRHSGHWDPLLGPGERAQAQMSRARAGGGSD